MPLSVASVGEECIIKRVGGKPAVKQRLNELGFVVGERVRIISKLAGNIIVSVKETRLALDGNLAKDIFI